MSPILKTIATTVATTVGATLVLGVVYWGYGLTADPLVRKSTVTTTVSVFQLRAEAEARFELLAAENETDRLMTQLEIVKIRLERFVETAKVRPLTESEQIELRAIEKERDALLSRLASKG